jgi:hypothetical protein
MRAVLFLAIAAFAIYTALPETRCFAYDGWPSTICLTQQRGMWWMGMGLKEPKP